MSSHRLKMLFRGVLAIAVGIVWVVLAYRLFPSVIIGRASALYRGHGALLWPLGFAVSAVGVGILMVAQLPAWGLWVKRHKSVLRVLGIALTVAIIYVDWR